VSGRTDRAPLSRSWVPWIVLGIVLLVALAVGTFGSRGPTTAADRALAIEKTIKCPVCQGETVAESNAGISQSIRLDVAQRIDQGQSDDQIRAYYAAQYPGDILTPTGEGVEGLVWILPVVALVAASAGLAVAFRRWGSNDGVTATDEDRELVAQALAGDADQDRG
jgi:cytochrome c-type biogenesis protein CcmH